MSQCQRSPPDRSISVWARRVLAALTPSRAHYAGLIVAAIVLAIIQSTQWFFIDELAFLKVDAPPLLWPHLGHLSIAPNLILHGMLSVFGLNSYLPYVLLALAAHLAVVHLLWRIMRRVGVGAWVSTAVAFLLSLLGAGYENLLWAFQFAFMGAIAIGLGAVLVLDQKRVTWRRLALATALLLVAITFAGTAIPLVVASALVAWRYGGFLKAVVLAAATGIPYLAWYVTYSRVGDRPSSGLGIHAVTDLTQGVPEFFSRMFVDTLDQALPFKLIAPAIVLAVIVWMVARARTFSGPRFTALALAAASVTFAAMTAVSRLDFGMGNAASSRYIYAQYVLCAAIVALILTEISHRLTGLSTVAAIAAFAIVLVYNFGLLIAGAHTRAAWENTVHEIFSAALVLQNEDPGRFDPLARPTPTMAPDITIGDLIALQDQGYFTPGEFSASARDTALANLTDPGSQR